MRSDWKIKRFDIAVDVNLSSRDRVRSLMSALIKGKWAEYGMCDYRECYRVQFMPKVVSVTGDPIEYHEFKGDDLPKDDRFNTAKKLPVPQISVYYKSDELRYQKLRKRVIPEGEYVRIEFRFYEWCLSADAPVHLKKIFSFLGDCGLNLTPADLREVVRHYNIFHSFNYESFVRTFSKHPVFKNNVELDIYACQLLARFSCLKKSSWVDLLGLVDEKVVNALINRLKRNNLVVCKNRLWFLSDWAYSQLVEDKPDEFVKRDILYVQESLIAYLRKCRAVRIPVLVERLNKFYGLDEGEVLVALSALTNSGDACLLSNEQVIHTDNLDCISEPNVEFYSGFIRDSASVGGDA